MHCIEINKVRIECNHRKIILPVKIVTNVQIWRVAIPIVNTSKVVKLPNTYNGNYEALHSASLNPERKK